jgi:two-component system phosphate regulon sensor histidine kinase PhoR
VQRKLFWQIFSPLAIALLLTILVLTAHLASHSRSVQRKHAVDPLLQQAALMKHCLLKEGGFASPADVQRLCDEVGDTIDGSAQKQTRLTVVRHNGEVVGDSRYAPATLSRLYHRAEIQSALSGETSTQVRREEETGEWMLYAVVPVERKGEIVGAVRAGLSLRGIQSIVSGIWMRGGAAAGVVLLLAAAVSYSVSRRISQPLEEVRLGATRFARGELDRKLSVIDSNEVGGLAEAMNSMAAQLDERIATIIRERNEKEAILGSMVEAVLAVDRNERIIHLNLAAARLLDTTREGAQGRLVHEVVRNPDLLQFVARTLVSRGAVEGELILHLGEEERCLQTRGTRLLGPDAPDGGTRAGDEPAHIGGLIVFNDITRLRRLETVRRDFVANVSHELRTPITSIKGFVETLQDGALTDVEQTRRFLEIVNRQADRLNAIINDLLSLSRIEREIEGGEVQVRVQPLRSILDSAVETCGHQAREKEITLRVHCEDHVECAVNAPLLEQAVVNLLSNAIKYSDVGSLVEIGVEPEEDAAVSVYVRDQGCGIGKDHLPRIFERFYRVDKARSRKLGGTGLGLSIVKNIAVAHGGCVSVESELGVGSTFTMLLPATSAAPVAAP